MADRPSHAFVDLDLTAPIWDRFFTVTPLVVIGTRDEDGRYDFARLNTWRFPWAGTIILVLSARLATRPIAISVAKVVSP